MLKATSEVKPTLSTKIKLSLNNYQLKRWMCSNRIFKECCVLTCMVQQSNIDGGLENKFYDIHLSTKLDVRTSPDTFLWNVRSTELQCITCKQTRRSFRDIKRDVFIGYVWHGPPCITVYSITQCWVGCGMTYLVQKSMYCFAVAAAPTTSVFLTPRHRPTEGASCEINPFWSDRQFLRVQFEEIHGSIILYFPLPSIVIIRQHLHG